MSAESEQIELLTRLVHSRAYSGYTASREGHLGGSLVQELETHFADYIGARFAVAVSSATAGLHIALLACGLAGKPVTTTPVTFSATASSIIMAGGSPIFRDIEDSTYCLQPTIQACILPVHLHGHPADMSTYHAEHIVEDCAQALGAVYKGRKVGTIGQAGVFSFNQHKQMQCGEGGMVVTNNERIADTLRLLRNHGETQSAILGYNYRMTELQAAILIPLLKRIEDGLQRTIELCETVTRVLKEVPELTPPVVRPGCRHVYYTYPVRIGVRIDRDRLQEALLTKGVYFGRGGYKPLHLFPFYSRNEKLPVAEDCYRTVMYTNIFRPPMKVNEARQIAEVVKDTVCHLKHTS